MLNAHYQCAFFLFVLLGYRQYDMRNLILLLVIFQFVFSTASYAQKIADKKDIEVSIEIEGGTLYGSFLVPKSKKPIPVVLLIPGSGPTDRDCNSAMGLSTNAFLYLAESLYKEGIATLRVDKRTSGKSQATFIKSFDKLTFSDFIADAEHWVDTLKKDKRFSEVIVAGHSQGALVGLIAAEKLGADKYISIAGPGRTIDKIMVDQFEASIPGVRDSCRMLFDSIIAGSYFDDAPSIITRSLPKSMAPFMRDWISYDPEAIISDMDIPILILNGANDLQVDSMEAVYLHEANQKSKLVIIPGMNHVLKDAPVDRLSNFSTYNQPDLPINEQVSKEIILFIKEE